MMNKKVQKVLGLMAIVAVGWEGLTSRAFAETELKFNKWVEEVKIKGDIRLRHENFERSGGTPDRQRQRIRLRIGADAKLPHKLKAHVRLTTGEGGDQVSTNQTLTDNADRKEINVDTAYIGWKPIEQLDFRGGKMKNPFLKFKASSRDVMWDGDYQPEGLHEGVEIKGGNVHFFVNLGQFGIEERSGSTEDSYLFSEEAGIKVKIPGAKLAGAIAHHEFTNVHLGGVGGVGSFGTNTAGARFSILEFTGEVGFKIVEVPVAVSGTYLNNSAAPKTTVGGALATAEEQDEAVHVGVVVGKAKKQHGWEAAYFWKEVEQDAAVAGITDSDMPGTTNTKGHILWIAYAITDFIKAQIKHWDAEDKVVAAGAADNSINRTQFDLAFKF